MNATDVLINPQFAISNLIDYLCKADPQYRWHEIIRNTYDTEYTGFNTETYLDPFTRLESLIKEGYKRFWVILNTDDEYLTLNPVRENTPYAIPCDTYIYQGIIFYYDKD